MNLLANLFVSQFIGFSFYGLTSSCANKGNSRFIPLTREPKHVNSFCLCGVSDGGEQRIIGGSKAKKNEFPWMSILLEEGYFKCGASLISNYYVLTAAHCILKPKKPHIHMVVVRGFDMTVSPLAKQKKDRSILRLVKAFKIHPKFSTQTPAFDIALIRMRTPVQLSLTLPPVCLPKTYFQPDLKQATASGFGQTEHAGISMNLLKVDLKVESSTYCSSKYNSFSPEYQLCTSTANKDTCLGDSGGPLHMKNKENVTYMVGVVSFGGTKCADMENPGVYVRMSTFYNWIISNTEDDSEYCEYTIMGR